MSSGTQDEASSNPNTLNLCKCTSHQAIELFNQYFSPIKEDNSDYCSISTADRRLSKSLHFHDPAKGSRETIGSSE